MIRPTLRAVLLFGATVPAAALPILFDTGLWPIGLVALALVCLLAGIDAILLPGVRQIAVANHVPAMLYIGDRDAFAIDLANRGRLGIAAQLRCEVGALLLPPPPATASIGAGQAVRVELPLVPLRRGRTAIERLWLRWSGPLGLAMRQYAISLNAATAVVPNIHAVRVGAAQFFARDALYGIKSQNQQGDGSEFDALRAYMPGLDHRSIDWKHSARHRSLVCKEFRAERNHQIILAFDTGYLMSEPLAGIPRLDHAINAGLLLGFMSLKSGDRVGLFGFDSTVHLFAAPAGGTQHFPRLQRLSAELAYRHEETNYTLGLSDLHGRLNRRSLIILMTDFVDTIGAELMIDNVARLSARHLVVCVALKDPKLAATVEAMPRSLTDLSRSVVADSFLRERAVVFERLTRLGVHCLEVPAERMGMELLNRYLLIKRRELI
jgi:uncharacterized protein (DUF58 family)